MHRTVSRRSFTPTPPLAAQDIHGTRRQEGGARREASERILLRREGFETAGWTLNLSRGGVRVIVEDTVEPGLEYEIVIGDEESASRRARVIWVQDEADGQIAGVQFLDVEGEPPPPPPAGG